MQSSTIFKTLPLSLFLLFAILQASGHTIPGPHESIIAQGMLDEEHPARHAEQIAPITVKQLRAFLDRFVDAGKTPEEQATFFAEPVEYYNHGIVGKSAIIRDVERFARHWPKRSYRVAQIDYINRDPESEQLFVSYTIDFEVANRSKTIKGRANYGALISNLGNSPKIESIKEKVVERKSVTFLHD
jgi:hypothetical protein